MKPNVVAKFPDQTEAHEHDLDFEEVSPPEPRAVVDETHVRNLAATRQTAQIERRAENTRFHDWEAKKVFRRYIAAIQSFIKKLDWELSQRRPRLAQTKKKKASLERFGRGSKGKDQPDQKQPATRWTQSLFGGVLAIMLIAIANGTFTVSSVMLDSTAFSGAVAKTTTVALGLFLMPSLALSVPFHLLRDRLRLAKSYLLLLVSLGMGFYFLFALTWAHTYAVETGNQLLIDLTTIGMGGESEETTTKPWLFENSNWLTLLAQILADACFAGAAKCYCSYLTWTYALFRRKAFQQDPEWRLLDQEERELSRQIAEIEAQKKLALERLEQLEDQQEEFTSAVCSLADALFLKEVDTYEHKLEQKKAIEKEVAEKEQEWRRSRHLLDDFIQDNPGVQKGMHYEDSE